MNKFTLLLISIAFTLQTKAQTVSDVDGNTYNTVTIGTQTWMKENLKTTKYNDGTIIPNVTIASSWDALTSPGYCWYNNDVATYKPANVGALYNWYTVQTTRLCPSGWHVPTDDEWTTLADYLTANGFGYEGSGDDIAKSLASKTGWRQCSLLGTPGNNPESNNSTNFSAVLSGDRDNMGGSFLGIDYSAEWWSSTESATLNPYYRQIAYDRKYVFRDSLLVKANGLPVRCLKDVIFDPVNTLFNPADNVIYPNPATDKLYIKNTKLSNATITIYDLQGKQIMNIPVVSNGIDISALPKGVYMVKVEDAGRIMVRKIIKE